MPVLLKLERSVPVLSVGGRLDARGAVAFDEAWATLPAETTHVVVDLTGMDYLSSLGIRSLVTAEKSLREHNGWTILAGLSPFASSLLNTVGLLGQFQHVPDVAEAVEQARAAAVAAATSTEHTIDGRRYRLVRHSTEPCFLELWGNLELAPAEVASVFSFLEKPVSGAPIEANLAELGTAFGVGALGNARSQAADCIGPFVGAAKFVGVLPADSPSLPDFVLSERPEETEVAIARAVGFSGAPTASVDVAAAAPARLNAVLGDIAGLLAESDGSVPAVMGFVMQVSGTPGRLLVGLFSPEAGKLFGNGITYETGPTLTPKLEDLKGVAPIEPNTLVQTASISLYLPVELRLGVEKRLKIQVEGDIALREEWRQIIRRLYRDCSRVILTQLTGGYMATTFRVASYDGSGRRLLPTVLKISTVELIQREEAAHRACVEKFILNNSTTIMGTATVGDWAALRYNFLGISGPDTTLIWFLEYYRNQPTEAVQALLHRLYTQILKPWYGQPRWEPIHLYADHSPLRLFPNLCAHAKRDFGFSTEQDDIECVELGIKLPNPFHFLETEYAKRAAHSQLWYQGINHGDLNLRNILVDEQENLYVIDFSETRPRNIVSDFARMETILKFETTRIETSDDVARMVEFELGLAEARSLADVPPYRYKGDDPKVVKAYAVICQLRKHADTVTLFETDIVPYWLALLEWTFSVLSYDLPPLRRKLAAYSAAILCGGIRAIG
jgi:anti-anti-sigma factor